MSTNREKEKRFLEITGQYKTVISKVCFLYQSSSSSFEDLYQEVLLNLWQGIDSFRGDAKISTWIYRTALNTCISWHRRNIRHTDRHIGIDDLIIEPTDTQDDTSLSEQYKELLSMIAALGAVDKAIITLWLDGNPYEEISRITGLSVANVATKLHRIKERLANEARKRSV